MAVEPLIPSGYDERFDMKYQLVILTIKTQKQYNYTDIEKIIREEYGDGEFFHWFKPTGMLTEAMNTYNIALYTIKEKNTTEKNAVFEGIE